MTDTADVEDYVYAFLDDNYPNVAKEMAAKVKRKLTAPTAPEDNLESVLELYKKQCSQPPAKKAKNDSSSSSGDSAQLRMMEMEMKLKEQDFQQDMQRTMLTHIMDMNKSLLSKLD